METLLIEWQTRMVSIPVSALWKISDWVAKRSRLPIDWPQTQRSHSGSLCGKCAGGLTSKDGLPEGDTSQFRSNLAYRLQAMWIHAALKYDLPSAICHWGNETKWYLLLLLLCYIKSIHLLICKLSQASFELTFWRLSCVFWMYQTDKTASRGLTIAGWLHIVSLVVCHHGTDVIVLRSCWVSAT